MRNGHHAARALAALLGLAAGHANADQVIGTGGVVSLGAATVSLGCTDLYVAGTLNFEQGAYVDVRRVYLQTGGVINGDNGTLVVAAPIDIAPGGTFNSEQLLVQASIACGGAVAPPPQPLVIPATATATLLALASLLVLVAAVVLRNHSREMRP
jgi:hypothetical protein